MRQTSLEPLQLFWVLVWNGGGAHGEAGETLLNSGQEQWAQPGWILPAACGQLGGEGRLQRLPQRPQKRCPEGERKLAGRPVPGCQAHPAARGLTLLRPRSHC